MGCILDALMDRIPALSIRKEPGNLKEAGRAKSCQGVLTSKEVGETSEEVKAAQSAPESSHWVNPMLRPVRAHDSHLSNASPWGSGPMC